MNYKFFQPEEYDSRDTLDGRQAILSEWRMRSAIKDQKKQFQRRLFGEHFNYSKVGLNKEKKYLIQ